MATPFKLEIVTPTGRVFAEDVDMVTLPGQEGEMGVLPMHTPLITLLGDGEVIARIGTREERFLVTGGCAEVGPERVAILTMFATAEDDIDELKAEAARERAEARLKDKENLTPEETSLVQAALAHSLAQLRIKRKQSR
jgi:F-type H+-transporting ATPase subunit epsilon